MHEYIDRNMLKRLIKWIPMLRHERCDYWDVESVINVIDTMPCEDVQPVIHAHWIDFDDDYGVYDCSYCEGRAPCDVLWEYCPRCGAKMDEDASK